MKSLGDFLYHEGPLLSHVVNEKNENYLMLWAGQDAQYNRWLLSKTTLDLLHQYFQKRMNLREVILSNPDGFVYFVDIDNDIVWRRAYLVENSSIESESLPGENSYFGTTFYEEYAYQLKSSLESHFARQQKVYETIEPEAAHVMEPPSDNAYRKKNK